MGVSKGKGYQGCIKRWGVKKLPKKTHRGYRRVGCIGSWHPRRVRWTVPRSGQLGYTHRTEANKKIYLVGKKASECPEGNARTAADPCEKHITPLGGFPHYGIVN